LLRCAHRQHWRDPLLRTRRSPLRLQLPLSSSLCSRRGKKERPVGLSGPVKAPATGLAARRSSNGGPCRTARRSPRGRPCSDSRHRRSPRPSAAVEPGSIPQPSPPRAGWRVARRPLDRPLPLGQVLDAPEAHPDLGMLRQAEQARPDRPIPTTPAPRARRFEVVTTDSRRRHGCSVAPGTTSGARSLSPKWDVGRRSS
jgi:hypothetical protein